MLLIIITEPTFFDGEAGLINLLFERGLQRLHLRKPDSNVADFEGLIQQIDSRFYDRIVIHDHHHLAVKYNLFGIHLNRRNSVVPDGFGGSVSRSLHTVEELASEKGKYNYVTLSPIFDSVSKVGYNSQFPPQVLDDLRKRNLIDSHVIALGGVTASNIATLSQYGFGGAMVLGALWNLKDDRARFLEYFEGLMDSIQYLI